MHTPMKQSAIKECKDLKVYTLSYDSAMEIFNISKQFPKEEKYSLTSQIIRSSRSVPANIREGFAKRKYEQVFIRHLIDAIGSAEETKTWLDFALDCKYISKEDSCKIYKKYKEITAMLFSLINKWKTF